MPTDKVARWLDLVAFLLQHRFPVTREEIFEAVGGYVPGGESARRKFERDKDELRALGIAIETVELKQAQGDEAGMGYRLRPAGLYLPYLEIVEAGRSGDRTGGRKPDRAYPGLTTVALSAAEAAVLDRATRRLAQRTELPLSAAAASARRKLAFDLPLTAAEVERVLAIPLPDDARQALAVAQRCVAEQVALRCRYHAPGRDADEEREVEPYGLVFRRGHWYCVGRARDREALRIFRVDRMRGAHPLPGEGFDVPAAFDVRAYVRGAPWQWGDGPAARVRVRFAFPESRWVLNEGTGTPVEPLLDDGAAVMEFEVRRTEPFLRWLLSFGRRADVVAPAHVAAELATLKARVAALYE